jgi:hypothetical protein
MPINDDNEQEKKINPEDTGLNIASQVMDDTERHYNTVNPFAEIDMNTLNGLISNLLNGHSFGDSNLHFLLNKNKGDTKYILKTKIKNEFIKNKPSWNKLFNMFDHVNPRLKDLYIWGETIEFIDQHRQILGQLQIFPNDYIALFPKRMKSFTINILLQELRDDLFATFYEFKTDQFIKKNMSKKHRHLINKESESIILELIENNIPTEKIKSMVISKVSNIKNTADLNQRLIDLFSVCMNWNLKHYLNICEENNIEVISQENNILIVSINSFKNIQLLAPSTWCIKTDEQSFNSHFFGSRKQFIEINFKERPNSPLSIIGATVSQSGSIMFAHDCLNHNIINHTLIQKYKELKISDIDYLKCDFKNFNKACITILKERKYLFETFLNSNLDQIQEKNIDYLDRHKELSRSESPLKASYIAMNILDNMHLSHDYNPYIYNHMILPYLLTTDNIPSLLVYLNMNNNILNHMKLALSTNDHLVDNKTKKAVFNWIQNEIK